MLYLFNTTTEVYKDLYRQAFENWNEYMDGKTEDATVYEIMFIMGMTDIFGEAKRRSAIRGRYAKDGNGNSLLESFAMTDDERDFFDSIMQNGSSEVFRKMLAFAKDVDNAHRYNVSFGVKSAEGTITTLSGDRLIITDTSLSLTPNALAGQRLVITTEGDNKDLERDISENTANTITITMPFLEDLTGLDYAVYNPNEKFMIYSIKLDFNWEFNMLMNAESAVREALILYALKEWYKTNRYMEDYGIEEAEYQKQLQLIRSSLIQQRTISRRPTDQFALY